MKQQWWAYVIVAVLSVGAGVAIAGLPNNVPVDATIVPPSTTEAPAPTSTTTPPAPSTTTTTTTVQSPGTSEAAPATTEVPAPELPERSELRVAAANGANVLGAAARMTERLQGLGYVDAVPLDGTEIDPTTVVYYIDGLELSAARLAEDLGLAPTEIAPLAVAPPVLAQPADIELLVYIGTDLA